jgi:hypothetical protein
MMIIRGVKEWYLASLQNDDHPVRNPGTILLLHELSSFCKDARYHSFSPRVIRGVKEWYLASLQNDDHSWSKRMVPGVLTE